MSKAKLLQRYVDLGHDFNPDTVDIQKTLRINTLKISESDCVARLRQKSVTLTALDHIPAAYVYDAPFPLVSSEEYLLGYLYLQETASMLPALILLEDGATPKSILDMCAAPGSKTTQLAQLTQDKIPIIALDITLPRLKKIEFNCERLGIQSVLTYRKDAVYAADILPSCSHVLLDAPCSGNFCIEADYFTKRSPRDFKDRSRLQKELFRSAYQVLEVGGTLVYSTCSLEPEEDELLVQWALDTYEDMVLVDISLPYGEPGATTVFGNELSSELAKTRKLWPDKTKTQGFFLAKFTKKQDF